MTLSMIITYYHQSIYAPTISEIIERTLMLIIITSPLNEFTINETSSLPSHEVFNPDPKVEQQWKKPEFSTLSMIIYKDDNDDDAIVYRQDDENTNINDYHKCDDDGNLIKPL